MIRVLLLVLTICFLSTVPSSQDNKFQPPKSEGSSGEHRTGDEGRIQTRDEVALPVPPCPPFCPL